MSDTHEPTTAAFDPDFNCPTHFAGGDPMCPACQSKQPVPWEPSEPTAAELTPAERQELEGLLPISWEQTNYGPRPMLNSDPEVVDGIVAYIARLIGARLAASEARAAKAEGERDEWKESAHQSGFLLMEWAKIAKALDVPNWDGTKPRTENAWAQVVLDKITAERDALAAELNRWRDLYGTDEPSDGVIGTAVGKIVAERNVEVNKLKAELATLKGARVEWTEEDLRLIRVVRNELEVLTNWDRTSPEEQPFPATAHDHRLYEMAASLTAVIDRQNKGATDTIRGRLRDNSGGGTEQFLQDKAEEKS